MNDGSQTTRFRISVRDDELAAVLRRPEGNLEEQMLAVLVHGGPGGVKDGPADLFKNLAEVLADSGIASLRFDFAGAGESTGSYRDMTISRQVEELNAVLAFVKDELTPRRTAIVGESYGATSAILATTADTSALVLLWPCIWLLDKAFESFVTPQKMHAARSAGFIVEEGEEVGLRFLEELIEIDNVAGSLEGSHVPTLFIHGNEDSEVPYTQSVKAAEKINGPKRVVLVPGGDHCLEAPAEREVVNREVADWLKARL